MAVRRSTRLEAKKTLEQVVQLVHTPRPSKRKRVIASAALHSSSESEAEPRERVLRVPRVDESGDESGELDKLVVTPNKTRARKTNNFLKVHNSYNRDYGLDLYEGDFIDDNYTPMSRRKKTLRRRKERQRKRSHTTISDSSEDLGDDLRDSYSGSSSPVIGQRSKKRTLVKNISSGESGTDTGSHGNELFSDIKPDVIKDTGTENCRIESASGIKNEAPDSPKNVESTVTEDPTVRLEPVGGVVPVPTDMQLESSLSVEEDLRKKREVDEDSGSEGSLKVKRRVRSFLSGSSEEDTKNDLKARKKRRVKRPESDDEISFVLDTPLRLTSSRAEKLKRNKMMKTDHLLQRMKRARDQREAASSSQSEDDDVLDDESKFKETYISSPSQTTKAVPEEAAVPWCTLAETILFPTESDDSSSEGSDWIVSDEDVPDVNGDVVYIEGEILMKGSYPLESSTLECEGSVEGDGGEGVRQEQLLLQAVTSEDSVSKLRDILPEVESYINTAMSQGRTPLMLAALKGDNDSLTLLLHHGAHINCRDSSGTTALHLAALSGCVECVNTLIARGHMIECRDAKGWSPLLYAHFGNHQDCVLTLMRARPQQLSVLSDLLKGAPEEGTEARRKTVKVVRSLLVSLAHHESYYSLFNDFIRHNLSVLDEDGFGFMRHCMALLSFENKQAWLKNKLRRLKEYAAVAVDGPSYGGWEGISLCELPRERVLETVRERLSRIVDTPQRCWLKSMFVTFKGEPGICTGPRKEFWSCLSQAISNNEKLFKQTDEGNLSLQPCSIFSKYCYSVVTPTCCHKHNQLLHLIGMMMAFSVFHGDTVDINLSKPLLKKLVGLPLTHPDDLEDVDHTLYHTITSCLKEEGINDLDLTFTTTLLCPWTRNTVDVPIKEGGRSLIVTDQNKDEYIQCLSEFKVDASVRDETDSFLSGFWKVIPQKCLEVFKPNELSLLISGVPIISVDDWCTHTVYRCLKPSDECIVWFWKLVRSLKEEEKALLLKFATGSPRVPAGGFSQLLGLGGPTMFLITLMPGMNKIPQASTCFNALKLSDYSCEQELRDKVLIAIRYGCEGFEFS